jgi:hypothetical protein
MKIDKKLNDIAESVLAQLDSVGFRLDAIGVENQINRHNLIALIMFGQKRLEGEMDSLSAVVDTGKSKIDNIARSAEKLVVSATDLALFPATYTIGRLKAKFA